MAKIKIDPRKPSTYQDVLNVDAVKALGADAYEYLVDHDWVIDTEAEEVKPYLKGYVAPESGTSADTGDIFDVDPYDPLAGMEVTPNSASKLDQFGLSVSNYDNLDPEMVGIYKDLVGQVSELASQEMSGEIPQDVQDSIVKAAAYRGMIAGLGPDSQATRYLTTKDLGLTSLQMSEAGYTKAQGALSNIDAFNRFMESRRQFDQNFSIAIQEHMDNVRRTDLSVAQLIEEHRQFDITANLKINEIIANTTLAGLQLQYNYNANPMEGIELPDSALADIENLISDLEGMLG